MKRQHEELNRRLDNAILEIERLTNALREIDASLDKTCEDSADPVLVCRNVKRFAREMATHDMEQAAKLKLATDRVRELERRSEYLDHHTIKTECSKCKHINSYDLGDLIGMAESLGIAMGKIGRPTQETPYPKCGAPSCPSTKTTRKRTVSRCLAK